MVEDAVAAEGPSPSDAGVVGIAAAGRDGAAPYAHPLAPTAGATGIVVNGRNFAVRDGEVSHERIVAFAFGRAHGGCTVAWGRGPAGFRDGILLPGRSVPIVDDEVFVVARTVRS